MSTGNKKKLKKLQFVNSDATPKKATVYCDKSSLPSIMAWYGAYYSGDRYYVMFDDKQIKKDQNGELMA